MPGNVQNANPVEVLPETLSMAFESTWTWAVRENQYANGESQRDDLVTTARRAWALTKRLTAAQLTELRAFFEARQGSMEPFYFYDGTQTSPKWSWDATGVTSTGRYTVRFAQASWEQAVGVGARGEVSLTLIELT
jgi:hypothetical protein